MIQAGLERDAVFASNKAQTLKFMYPFQFLVSSTTNNKKSLKNLERIDIFLIFAAENTIRGIEYGIKSI